MKRKYKLNAPFLLNFIETVENLFMMLLPVDLANIMNPHSFFACNVFDLNGKNPLGSEKTTVFNKRWAILWKKERNETN